MRWSDHGLRFDASSRAADHDPIAVSDTALVRELRRDFDEHVRVKLVEPAIEAAHRPAQVMLGKPVGGANQLILAVARCSQLVERPVVAEGGRIVCRYSRLSAYGDSNGS